MSAKKFPYKTRRNIYFLVGALLIFFNLLVDLLDVSDLSSRIIENDSLNIGYLIGSQFLLLTGIILLRFGLKIHKKLEEQNNLEIEKSIEEIGKPS